MSLKLSVEKLSYESAKFRTPLKFGASVVKDVVMPIVTVRLSDGSREGIGVGAMPLGNAWSFPSAPHEASLEAMGQLTERVARAIHGLKVDASILCVQDLTCPGLALLASTSLAAWLGVEAIEANARQFCPAANADWARRRPEVFSVRSGRIQTGKFTGHGLGFGDSRSTVAGSP